ncbi:hypothetical protein LCGC14_1422550 [marine sediment metagenome]|uniref:Uncharacterized protein n=1 Tax=marine sediment metagenome TaxID=412755 RepID=A0A0F9M6E4_9ZZZZ
MGDKGTQQFIPGTAPSTSFLLKPSEQPLAAFLPLEKGVPGKRKKTSTNATAAKKKKRKRIKKARKNNR